MVQPQSESDFPGKGRLLDRNQSPSAAKRRKQVGVSITACRGPLRLASGGPSSSVQSLNISPTEWVICFCCEAAVAVHTRQLLLGHCGHCVQKYTHTHTQRPSVMAVNTCSENKLSKIVILTFFCFPRSGFKTQIKLSIIKCRLDRNQCAKFVCSLPCNSYIRKTKG